MRRGIGARIFTTDDLAPADVFVERTDRDEILIEIAGSNGAEESVYLTVEAVVELERALMLARTAPWRRR